MVRKVKAIGFQGAERSLTGLAATERQRSAESGSGSGNLWAGIRKVSTAGTLLVVLAAYMMYTMSSERRQVARRFGRGHIAATPNPTIDGDVHRATAALTTRTAITATETVPAQLTEATTTVGGFPPRKADHRDRQREQAKRASAALIPEPTGCERTEQSSGWRSPTIRHIQTQLPKLFNYKAEDSSLVYRLQDLLCGDQGSWYKPDRNCVGKCCATTCLMPWEPGMHAPVMVTTPLEMGDLSWGSRGFKLRGPGLVGRTPPGLNDGMLPCMQPGTIIAVATGVHTTRFLAEVHPKIQVPYVITIGDGDAEVPSEVQAALDEEGSMLKHVFAHNPNPAVAKHPRFTAMPVGLSRWHPQSLYLRDVLEARGYVNPFASQQHRKCWSVFTNDTGTLFMSYMTGGGRGAVAEKQRANARQAACHGGHDRLASCPGKIGLADLYHQIDDHHFGISPEGHGHDCYRTWEFLFLGMIPIVAKSEWTSNLYNELPVLQIDTFDISHVELRASMEAYLQSPGFLTSAFEGWRTLFMDHWRRVVLEAAGRMKIVEDPESGAKYFEVLQYTQ